MPACCQKCLQLPDMQKIQCDHIRPYGGIDKNRQTKRKAAYDLDIYTVMREKLGITTTNLTPYYNRDDLEYFSTNIWTKDEIPPHLKSFFIGVDPSNGGPCNTAIIGGFYLSDSEELNVQLADAKRVKDYVDYTEFIVNNLKVRVLSFYNRYITFFTHVFHRYITFFTNGFHRYITFSTHGL